MNPKQESFYEQLDHTFGIIDSIIKLHNALEPENPVNWDEVLNYFRNVKLHEQTHSTRDPS